MCQSRDLFFSNGVGLMPQKGFGSCLAMAFSAVSHVLKRMILLETLAAGQRVYPTEGG